MKKQAVLVPGIVLKEKYMDEYKISVATISKEIGLSPSAIRQLINNKLKISIKIAWKLSKYFDTPIEEWIELQNKYEIAELGADAEFMDGIRNIPKAKKVNDSASARASKAAERKPRGVKEAKAAGKKASQEAAEEDSKPEAAEKKPKRFRKSVELKKAFQGFSGFAG